MDTNPPFAAASDYAGLKEELQKIAGIIEQYPDQLKQRAFELLINAYLGRGNSNVSPAVMEITETQVAENAPPAGETGATDENATALASEDQATESAPAEVLSVEAGEENGDENGSSLPGDEQNASELEPDSRIDANLENTTNMLRRRIRLRTMSQMPWHQSS